MTRSVRTKVLGVAAIGSPVALGGVLAGTLLSGALRTRPNSVAGVRDVQQSSGLVPR